MPILGDLMNALLSQHIPEADRVAQALDLYVNGSLNFFNHRTTVDISNRLVCFDIKGLGKNLKKPGMLLFRTRCGTPSPSTGPLAGLPGISWTSSTFC